MRRLLALLFSASLFLWMSVTGPPALAANVLLDGGFEAATGTPPYSPNWIETSTNYGSPLCTPGWCGIGGGTAGPRTGAVWSWFGGAPSPEFGSLDQTLTIPSGYATLRFYLWIGWVGNGADYLRVLMDGNQVFHVFATAPGYASYQPVTLDVTPYANGGVHTLRFEGLQSTSAVTNMSVDDISLDVVGGAENPATLRVAVSGPGSGTVTSWPAGISCPPDCSETVPPFTSFQLTAHAAGGSEFDGWTGACAGGGNICNVTMWGDRTVAAAFDLSSVSPPPTPEADLSVTGAIAAAGAVGDELVGTFTVANGGPDAATVATLAITLPDHVLLGTVTASQGACVVSSTGELSCDLGPLASGASADVELALTPYREGDVAVPATVTGAPTDPDPSDDAVTLHAAVATVCTIVGTPGDDELVGTDGIDVVCAGGGADVVLGMGGNDILRGGPGRDTLRGGDGDDLVLGIGGADQLYGGPGTDTCDAVGADFTAGCEEAVPIVTARLAR